MQHSPPLWAVICSLIGVAVLLTPRGWPGRWIGAVWLLPLFLIAPPKPAAGELWFGMLDVGQGLAAVLRTQNHVLVYDTGPRFSDSFDTGEAAVVPYVYSQGLRHIDTLIISHADNDHRGGAESVLRAFPRTRVLSSAPDLPFANDACVSGNRWRWDSVEFEILHPADTMRSRHNNNSCVLRVRTSHGTLLLPGDIEKRAEQSLLARRGNEIAAQVLVAPHHGSKTSSHGEFVRAVKPEHVLFPVGYRNRYRHPHPAVLERYREAGAALYDSPSAGAIEFRFDAHGIRATAYRDTDRRYWFSQ
jgi:competence protein ComEC